jgi:hypothetical protein
MLNKLFVVLLPPALAMIVVAQSGVDVCVHPDGAGPTIAIDPAAVEKEYRQILSKPAGIELARSEVPKASPLPACRFRDKRVAQVAELPERVVGREFRVDRGDVPADVSDRFHLKCAPCRVKVLDRTHVEISEE